ncbi:MAG: hypothetical protein HY921_12650 [Elusimicrobia bacterium]|nr:hypothetical protein [Elusimicrobiota bacterium]
MKKIMLAFTLLAGTFSPATAQEDLSAKFAQKRKEIMLERIEWFKQSKLRNTQDRHLELKQKYGEEFTSSADWRTLLNTAYNRLKWARFGAESGDVTSYKKEMDKALDIINTLNEDMDRFQIRLVPKRQDQGGRGKVYGSPGPKVY